MAVTNAANSVRQRAERRIGTTLREKYRLDAILGVGGMATVYRAEHRNGSHFAIKILHAELSVDGRHQRRFVREGYVANSIAHRSAVRVLDDDVTEDGCPFLVMDLLEGETFSMRLRRTGPFSARDILVIGYELCQGFAAAHAAGIIHRDIKPDNLFLTQSGDVKILDFGIARMTEVEGFEGSTITGQMLGTPAFMPPEQAMGLREQIGPHTDVFALGATLFRLFTRSTIHLAETPEQLVVYAATRKARKLNDAIPSAPLPLAEVIDKALSFEAGDRFPDMGKMAEAFASAYQTMFGDDIRAAKLPNAAFPPTSLSPPNSVIRVTEQAQGEAATVAGQAARRSAPPESPSGEAETVSENREPTEKTKPSETEVPISIPTISRIPPTKRTLRERRTIFVLMGIAVALLSAALVVGLRTPSETPKTLLPIPHPSASASASASAVETCVSNAACIKKNGGKPSICRPSTGACVVLEHPHCQVVADPIEIENDETVWVGAMFPESVTASRYGTVARHDVELARRDFAKLVGGLPATKPGGKPRPIGVVACDDATDHADIARFLVDDVGVPAVLGFARSQEVLELAQSYFIPKGVLALCSNTAAMISSIPHPKGEPRLIFRLTTNAASMAVPRAKLATDVLEPMLRRSHGPFGEKEILKLATLRVDNTSGMSHADSFLSMLVWNGKSAAENGDAIRLFVASDSMDKDALSKWKRVVSDIVAFRPAIIFNLGVDGSILAMIEKAWPIGVDKPMYVHGGGLDIPALMAAVRSQPDLSKRLFGIDTSSAHPAVAQLVMHYNEAFSDKLALYDSMAGPYDSFYVFAFAAAALGDRPITGRALSGAISRLLPPGDPIDVGPAGIYPALSALSAGRNIDLQGAATSLDFDVATGDAPADMAVYCIDAKRGSVAFAGLTFKAATMGFEGKLGCP